MQNWDVLRKGVKQKIARPHPSMAALNLIA